jgi:hypothetical protein
MRFIHVLGYVGCVGIALVSIFQVVATAAGVAHFTGWGFTSWVVAIIVGWLPVIGTVTGSCGAISAWNWPWYGAVTFFTWPIILVMALFGIAVVESRMQRTATTINEKAAPRAGGL